MKKGVVTKQDAQTGQEGDRNMRKGKSIKENSLAGKVFVVTGGLEYFSARSEIKEVIERLGGKMTGSVTSQTSYLISNDIANQSSRTKIAKDLGIPIIAERGFVQKWFPEFGEV